MKWDELNMYDKASAIKMFVEHGVMFPTQMKEMYNSYAEGGPIQTEEEYIAEQAEIKRIEALNRSRTKTGPVVPILPNPQSKEEWQEEQDRAKEDADDADRKLTSLYLRHQRELPFTPEEEKEIRWLQGLINKQYDTYQSHCEGLSCLFTATDNYDRRVSGNQTFAANPEKYGFKQIDYDDKLPGDLIQEVYLKNGVKIPIHALIYDSQSPEGHDLFNYSRGSNIPKDYLTQKRYPFNDVDHIPEAFRFVGSSADSIAWRKNYASRTTKPLEIEEHFNSFQEGGPLELSDEDIENHENLYKYVNPAWGVSASISALRKMNYAKNNNININEGSELDNAAFRKYLGLNYDSKLLKESSTKPTYSKKGTQIEDKSYYTSDEFYNGISNQLDTVYTRKKHHQNILESGFYEGYVPNNRFNSSEGERLLKAEKQNQAIKNFIDDPNPDPLVLHDFLHPDYHRESSEIFPEYDNERSPVSALGDYTISKGKDDHGEYISFYDVFDFPWYTKLKFPNKNKIEEFEIYDRIYLKDLEKRMEKNKNKSK